VGGLVQLRHGCVDIIVQPHRVGLLRGACHGGEGEFDQRCRVSAVQPLSATAAVDGNLEPSSSLIHNPEQSSAMAPRPAVLIAEACPAVAAFA
jgi:hypothetical protein